MSRTSRWSPEDRALLLKMVREGSPEQAIRDNFSYYDKYGVWHSMSSASFAQQLKQAMVEAGEIKQAATSKENMHSVYKITNTGRLTIFDFQAKTGAAVDAEFILKPPRGRSRCWCIVPYVNESQEVNSNGET